MKTNLQELLQLKNKLLMKRRILETDLMDGTAGLLHDLRLRAINDGIKAVDYKLQDMGISGRHNVIPFPNIRH